MNKIRNAAKPNLERNHAAYATKNDPSIGSKAIYGFIPVVAWFRSGCYPVSFRES